MSGLIGKAMKFAKTKQGQEALEKVQKYAKSPEAKERIEEIKGKVSGKQDDADASPAAKPPAATKPKPAPAPGVDASAAPKSDPAAPSADTSGGKSSAEG